MKELKGFFSIIFLIYLLGLLFYAVVFHFQLSPVLKETEIDSQKEFFIEEGLGITEVVENLKKENLIKSESSFKFYLLIRGWAKKIKPGNYHLSSNLSSYEIARMITREEKREEIRITIPEGWVLEIIEKELFNKEIITNLKLREMKVKNFQREFEFLSSIPKDNNLEGFLFPETYIFKKNSTAKEIAKKFLETFEEKIYNNFKKEIEKDNLDFYQILTLASLIESEVPFQEDRLNVSNIIRKRLEINMPLQIDASIVYHKCFIKKQENCRILYKDDLREDSDYNTYTRKGLPEKPISNPGISAFHSSLHPKENNYWYYLSNLKTRETIFSETLKQHNEAKRKYLY
jgi:UPF0755 protein